MKKIIFFLSLAFFTINILVAQNNSITKQDSSNKYYKGKVVSISFISTGTGIDEKGFEKIISFLITHPKKPAYTVKIQGKEGEREIIVYDLSLVARKKFKKKVRELVVKKELVIIQEKKLPRVRVNF